jgi:general secretion pathway protein F
VVEGDTIKHVRQLLRDRQLLPVTVAEVKHGEAKRQRGFSLRRGISASDLSLLTRQLATLVKAGLPLEEALLAVSQQSEKPRIQSIMLGVRARSWRATRWPMASANSRACFPRSIARR